MRRLLTFTCEGAELGASLDGAAGPTGVVFVTGGTQIRIGSHRLFERLAAALSARGIPCFRYDRRGVGDSGGADPGWRGSSPDLAAAASTFRRECPGVERVIGIGLCDGATALALFGAGAGFDAAILLNPWLVEAEPGQPAPAAIRYHYQEQLRSRQGWRKILFGSVSWSKLFKGLRKIAAPPACTLAADVAAALRERNLALEVVLARGDSTAIAAQAELARPPLSTLIRGSPEVIETNSHTFARPGDFEGLLEAVGAALARLTG